MKQWSLFGLAFLLTLPLIVSAETADTPEAVPDPAQAGAVGSSPELDPAPSGDVSSLLELFDEDLFHLLQGTATGMSCPDYSGYWCSSVEGRSCSGMCQTSCNYQQGGTGFCMCTGAVYMCTQC